MNPRKLRDRFPKIPPTPPSTYRSYTPEPDPPAPSKRGPALPYMWKWCTDHNGAAVDDTWLVVVNADGKSIDTVLSYRGCGSHAVDVSPENAALIEAAPRLLKACIAAREELRLLRMKDTATVYDPTLRIVLDAAILAATKVRR